MKCSNLMGVAVVSVLFMGGTSEHFARMSLA